MSFQNNMRKTIEGIEDLLKELNPDKITEGNLHHSLIMDKNLWEMLILTWDRMDALNTRIDNFQEAFIENTKHNQAMRELHDLHHDVHDRLHKPT